MQCEEVDEEREADVWRQPPAPAAAVVRLVAGQVCGCPECLAAGVAELPVRSIPRYGLVHGFRLAAWHREFRQFRRVAGRAFQRAAVK